MFSRSLIFLFIPLIISLAVFTGCSRNETPISTDLSPVFAAELSEYKFPERSILGIYHVTIDTVRMDFEISPARAANLDLQVNLNPYLLGDPCQDCLRLSSIGLDSDKNLILDFGLAHAFQDVNIRPDLNGFDLRGILVMPGTQSFPLTPKTKAVFDPITHLQIRPEQTVVCNPDTLLNPDGYSPLWDYYPDDLSCFPGGIAGSINPYKNFFWEDNPDPLVIGAPIPWRTFYVGGGWDYQRYVLDSSKLGTSFDFYFIADVSYGKAATFATRQNPFYRNPQFNTKSAYDVQIETDGEILTGDVTSLTDLTIRIKDWQAGAPLVIYPPDPGQNEIDEESDVFRVTIEAPAFQVGLLSIDTPSSGSGSAGDPYVFTKAIRNLNGATTGIYPVLISIEDDLFETSEMDIRTFYVLNLEVVSSQTVIEFNPPERVTNNEHSSFVWTRECIAIDSSNHPHIVWTDDRTGYYQVYYSTRSGSGIWSTPENISQSTGQAYYATIAIDSLNRGHIAWEDSEGLVEGMNIHYGLKIGAGLASELDVTDYDEQVYGYFPRIVVDKTSNKPHIIWQDNNANGGDDYDIRYVKINASVTPPVIDDYRPIELTSNFEGQASIALTASGDPRVMFIREESSVHKLMFSKWSGGTFSTPVTVDNGPAYWPDVEISNAGIVTTVFYGGSGARTQIWAKYSATDGATWVSNILVSDTSTSDQVMPDIAIDSYGVAHFMWHEIEPITQIPGRIKYKQYGPGGLSGLQEPTPPGYPSAFPSVVVDSNNELHLAIETFIDDNYEIFYITSAD